MTGHEVLAADGFRFIAPAAPLDTDYDGQGHLNNAAIVRLFNDLRVAYVQQAVGMEWVETIRRERLVIAAREVHVLYESEAFPGEALAGAMRYVKREGKGAVLEQRLVEAGSGRSVASAWVVQLIVRDGTVIDWPAAYFERVAHIEGKAIAVGPRPERPWGPG